MALNRPALYLDAVLAQKLALFRALRRAVALKTVRPDQPSGDGKLHHPSADEVLKFPCPLHGASMGQHMRHSLDHVRKAIDASLTLHNHNSLEPSHDSEPLIVAYDERTRGTSVEEHLVSAEREVGSLRCCLEEIMQRRGVSVFDLAALPLIVRFAMPPTMTAATTPGRHEVSTEDALNYFDVPSNAAREFAFVAHHAIHHNASILAIVKHNEAEVAPGLLTGLMELAPDFGKAPATVLFEKAVQHESVKGVSSNSPLK
jgi:hypothetical protein